MAAKGKSLVPAARIERAILLVRGEKVMLDQDLADLYGVETRVLVQAVKRNIGRFPSDFMFQLSGDEFADLRSQIVTSSWAHGVLRRTRSPSRASRCSPASCAALRLCR